MPALPRGPGRAPGQPRYAAGMVPLSDLSGLPAEQRAALERELAPLTLLQDVVRWGFAHTPPRDVAEVVVQDEFTHDVVVPWKDGRYLVFDTT
ncbi:hypothetical protein [Pyxidicoccus sp. MSG2]|uniref:hypothetical protein n=2 Tax=Pyxidicoccus TaxID=224458 RepID=UPI00226FFF35|nr:hypothetical protein [Pyxidicoccus sp. MSG2]MCY1015543.1 hypothetical protein [Pyxidicoccus sp. MSG2]